MKRLILALVVVGFLVIPTFVMAGGTVEEMTFYSQALGQDRAALVYLPEGYGTSGLQYPVVYLIHGHAGTAGNWYAFPEFVGALDVMIGDELVDPFILVEPDASCMPWAPSLPYPFPSHLTDSVLTGNHETALVEDVVGWVDSTYRTLVNPGHRFIFGRSAGGYGAARVALRHPDVFGGLGLQVGLVALEPVQYMLPMWLAEYPAGPPYLFNPVAGSISFMVFSWSAAFTPDLSNPPWSVDLIVDQDGNLDTAVWDRFVAQSPSRWAGELAASGDDLDIFMDGGTQDFMLPFTTAFAAALDAFALPYTLEMFDGDHENPPMWQRLQTHVTYFMPLNATVEINPDTVNLGSRGRWVTAYLELPGGLAVSDIDLSTIAITEVDGMDLATAILREGPTDISDVNGNGVPDLMVKFDRGDLIEQLGGHGGNTVALTVSGQLINGWYLEAVDTVRVVGRYRHGRENPTQQFLE